ncbi:hypothetical protein FIBSPDRAFT_852542 [Athelia psychrophila]|uniref:Uncharacterized protein n=1 Tax=Athelia psychrophila TaxID=1759441 RepID=A0A166RLG1_9AGAM|nr:hypothetical protein FIBSPDRAFT_877383 [Fibularhizoctonia sp. CBS 109695]KZP28401.1 hypothetical protein FIBSPDRAFT_852542 [Fibularhizoctonia sp. CBS 109695]
MDFLLQFSDFGKGSPFGILAVVPQDPQVSIVTLHLFQFGLQTIPLHCYLVRAVSPNLLLPFHISQLPSLICERAV